MLKRIKQVISAARQAWTMPVVEPKAQLDQVTRTGLKDIHMSGWTQDTGELVTGFHIGPEDTVLDIGCSDGGYATFSARQGAAIILADVDAAKLDVARTRLEAIPARSLQTLVTDADPIPLPDASVSRIVAMEVLEHVDCPAQFMAELVRVARPGALFLLTAPDEAIEGVQKHIAPPSYFEKPNHIRIFKRGELEQLARDAGLQIVDRFSYGFYLAVWWSLYWACENQSLSPPWHPLLEDWAKVWSRLLSLPEGLKIKAALDQVMPKSQVVIARKP
ncbi:class I SAM-dependent methyltransferase [Pseudomonas sp. N040]|uniref:class I SAM-dependent methyltransferase n=1 Tax=Pseudomonas sp. N040 TaxID=2785325 RepID=UPI0018A2CBD2|nr:class I SAM-dependent methyltransferase [Pseudomonas sp. N040]MBF7728981.1 methyltransferase domain-containing protein [Pseudomonas sp. N040]MBW7012621.1 methyltransferase domain-containing protein [Pseudomonas sp. N040]